MNTALRNPPPHHQAVVGTNHLHQIIVLIHHINMAIKEDQATERGQYHVVHQDLSVGLLLIEEIATEGHGHAVRKDVEDHEVLQIDAAGQGRAVKKDVEDQDHAVKKGVAGQDHAVLRPEVTMVVVPLQDNTAEIVDPRHLTGMKCVFC